MDKYDAYIERLKQFLKETPEEDRNLLWQETESLGISGPTVNEYFDSLQNQLNQFNDSLAFSAQYCDDISYIKFFNRSIEFVSMSGAVEIVNPIQVPNLVTGGCDTASAGECTYAMAA